MRSQTWGMCSLYCSDSKHATLSRDPVPIVTSISTLDSASTPPRLKTSNETPSASANELDLATLANDSAQPKQRGGGTRVGSGST